MKKSGGSKVRGSRRNGLVAAMATRHGGPMRDRRERRPKDARRRREDIPHEVV